MTFQPADLATLDKLLSKAARVCSMNEVHLGARGADVIGLRHDVDDNAGALETAVKIARWEAERGYTSTYFVLHGSRYWDDEPRLRSALEEISGHGHEVGVHCNAIAEALRYGVDPAEILTRAIETLRSFGHQITGVAPHGDRLCHHAGFVNDEMFTECARPEMGAPDRVLAWDGNRVKLAPRLLADFGLEYETYRLPRGRYISDSGGAWNIPPSQTPATPGQLHVLWHSDWWRAAFD